MTIYTAAIHSKQIQTVGQRQRNGFTGDVENFMAVLPQKDLDKLAVLSNFVSPSIFQHIEDCTDYEISIETLQTLFIKQKNEIFAPTIF